MIRAILSTLKELFVFMWANKIWWMAPVVVVLLIFSGLMFLHQAPTECVGLYPYVARWPFWSAGLLAFPGDGVAVG